MFASVAPWFSLFHDVKLDSANAEWQEYMCVTLALCTKAQNTWRAQRPGMVAGAVSSRLETYAANLRRFYELKRIK